MPRHFNTAGPCLPDKHYMLPPMRRLEQLRTLIDAEKFFVLHAPRQTGKTTLLRSLSRELTAAGTHAATTISMESFTRDDVSLMMPQVLFSIVDTARFQLPEALQPPDPSALDDNPDVALRVFLKNWAASIDLPLVVFIDEIDAIPGALLLSVLRQLRDGYTARPEPFAHSVALVGLQDVRDYRILRELRPDESSLGTASPFNIKDRSLTLRDFDEAEVRELLAQHTEETGQRFSDEAQGEIYEQTQGQPWLTNALAAQLSTAFDALVPDRTVAIDREAVMRARELLIERRDTHLDSLVDKLHEERVRRVLHPMISGETTYDETFNDDFGYARDLGLVGVRDGKQTIANPIYREIIPRALTFQIQTQIIDEPAWYVAADGTLDLRKLLDGFVEFWRGNGEVLLRGMPFHEAAPHLVFMAYLQRIVNSGGRVEREFAVGTRRADLVVEFGGRRDVIELKLARAYKARERGLEQVSAYAKRLGRPVGYLVLFELLGQTELPFEQRGVIEEVEHDGVTVVLLRA